MVADAWQSIDLTNPELVSDGLRDYLKCVRKEGHAKAVVKLMEQFRDIATTESKRLRLLVMPAFKLGQLLLDRLLLHDPTVFPTNDVEVHFRGNEIVLALSSMFQRSTTGGLVFHSRKRFTIDHGGSTFVLAFSRHAIDAICTRFKPDYQTYGGLGDAHALFSYLNYVEQVKLLDGAPAIAIFDLCIGPGYWEYDNYVKKCTPNAPIRGLRHRVAGQHEYGYRVGYCPIVFNESYAIAKTFLSPGYSKTPERGLIEQFEESSVERQRKIKTAGELDYRTLRYGDAMNLVCWFHQNGIPQVIDPPQPLFDQDYHLRKIGAT
jgi:hypothetical protein